MASKYRTVGLFVLAVLVFASLALLQAPDAAADGFDWSGFYVGAQGGYLWGALDDGILRAKSKSALWGGHVGYNYQLSGSPLVLGVEASAESESGSEALHVGAASGGVVPLDGTVFPPPGSGSGPHSRGTRDWTATARVRMGYALDWLMVYGAVGLSRTHWTEHAEFTSGGLAGLGGGGGAFKIRRHDDLVSLAGGVEAPIWGHVLARLEYRSGVGGERDRRVVAGLSYLFGQDRLEKAEAAAIDWTGFHVGVEGGYGRARTITEFPGYLNTETKSKASGGVGGFYAGYDYKFAGTPLVVGAETDFAYADVSDKTKFRNINGAVDERRIDSENWVGATRGRVGIAFDRMLFYANGGVAYAQLERDFREYGFIFPIHQDSKVWDLGWTVGGGAEFAVTDDIAARAEYRYASYGSDRRKIGAPFFQETERTKLKDERLMLGLAYRIH